jgi:hypothetical protein
VLPDPKNFEDFNHPILHAAFLRAALYSELKYYLGQSSDCIFSVIEIQLRLLEQRLESSNASNIVVKAILKLIESNFFRLKLHRLAKNGHTPFKIKPFQRSFGKLDCISIPPIPPPILGWPLSSLGASAIIQSVVSIKPASEGTKKP